MCAVHGCGSWCEGVLVWRWSEVVWLISLLTFWLRHFTCFLAFWRFSQCAYQFWAHYFVFCKRCRYTVWSTWSPEAGMDITSPWEVQELWFHSPFWWYHGGHLGVVKISAKIVGVVSWGVSGRFHAFFGVFWRCTTPQLICQKSDACSRVSRWLRCNKIDGVRWSRYRAPDLHNGIAQMMIQISRSDPPLYRDDC